MWSFHNVDVIVFRCKEIVNLDDVVMLNLIQQINFGWNLFTIKLKQKRTMKWLNLFPNVPW